MKDALFLSYVAEFATVLQSDEGIRYSEMEIFGPVMTEVWKSSGWPLRFYVRADRMAGRVLRMACGARTLNLTSLAPAASQARAPPQKPHDDSLRRLSS